ncbi:hypothetical protein HYR69_06285 [Candidatus Sumerlaeota bacterium]|nr:hypothetical protein [Candidatus Sumerlaeota bacterium]
MGLNTDQGSTYIFRYNGSTWVQEQKITSSDGAANDWFGFSVDTNGDMILVGALFHDIGVNADQGAAYIFGPPLPECGISLNPAEASFTASGGSGSVTVSVAEGCDWTAAASDPSWILISNPIGEGPGTINYTVTQNLIASPRDGTITVGDQTHTIHQCGALPVGSKLRAKIKAMGIPKSMTPGQVVHVLFIVTNTGNVTWTEECGFRLGKVNGTADPFGPERIDLPPGVSVAPGQSWTFETNLTAPQVPGAYTTKWQMLQEGNAWFGKPVQKRIKVVLPQQAINALLFSPSAGNAPDAEDEE